MCGRGVPRDIEIEAARFGAEGGKKLGNVAGRWAHHDLVEDKADFCLGAPPISSPAQLQFAMGFGGDISNGPCRHGGLP